MESRLKYAPSQNLQRHWPIAEPYLLDALANSPDDGQNIFDVMAALERGNAFLWTGEESAVVTMLEGDVYTLWLAGGDYNELSLMLPYVEDHARRLDAAKVVVFGRKGWVRSFLHPAGYNHTWTIMEKKLWAV
jgi:hypothetical protein